MANVPLQSIHNRICAMHTDAQSEWLKDTQKLPTSKSIQTKLATWFYVTFSTLTMKHSLSELEIPHSNFLFILNGEPFRVAFAFDGISMTCYHPYTDNYLLLDSDESEFYFMDEPTKEKPDEKLANYLQQKKTSLAFNI